MAEEHRGIAMVILGVVAVIAVVGLVLMFVQGKAATGQGIYGGAIKYVEYPYWTGRGVPQNVPGMDYIPGKTSDQDMTTNWNFYGSPKRNPDSNIPSPLTGCPGGFMVGSNDDQPAYYASKGYQVVLIDGQKGGFACVYPQESMLGGIAYYK